MARANHARPPGNSRASAGRTHVNRGDRYLRRTGYAASRTLAGPRTLAVRVIEGRSRLPHQLLADYFAAPTP